MRVWPWLEDEVSDCVPGSLGVFVVRVEGHRADSAQRIQHARRAQRFVRSQSTFLPTSLQVGGDLDSYPVPTLFGGVLRFPALDGRATVSTRLVRALLGDRSSSIA